MDESVDDTARTDDQEGVVKVFAAQLEATNARLAALEEMIKQTQQPKKRQLAEPSTAPSGAAKAPKKMKASLSETERAVLAGIAELANKEEGNKVAVKRLAEKLDPAVGVALKTSHSGLTRNLRDTDFIEYVPGSEKKFLRLTDKGTEYLKQ